MNNVHGELKNKKGSRKLKPNQNEETSTDGTLDERAKKRLGVVVTYLAMVLLLYFTLSVWKFVW